MSRVVRAEAKSQRIKEMKAGNIYNFSKKWDDERKDEHNTYYPNWFSNDYNKLKYYLELIRLYRLTIALRLFEVILLKHLEIYKSLLG